MVSQLFEINIDHIIAEYYGQQLINITQLFTNVI